MAEAYALSNAVEHGLRTQAIIVDMRGQFNIRQWEEMASAAVGHVWFTDCESLFAHLISEVGGSKGNYPRWINTSAMLSDCLAKTMASGRLNETLSAGIFVMRLTEESLAIKAKH